MRKTSIYLDPGDAERLRRLARRKGISQAEVVRVAIAAYERQLLPDRDFALGNSWEGDGTSIADVPDEDLLEGFAT